VVTAVLFSPGHRFLSLLYPLFHYAKLVIPFVRVAEPSNHERFAEEGYFV
jgi:hypothetical protein